MNASVYREADINYLSTTGPQAIRMPIFDARQSEETWAWRVHGFELQRFPSRVSDWGSEGSIEAVHFDEIASWAQAECGAQAVLFYPPVMRNAQSQAQSADFAPIQFAHSDYAESYAQMLADPSHPYVDLLAPSMQRAGVRREDLARARRIITLQVWRNTGPTQMAFPLCLADMRSVAKQQLFPLRVETYGGLTTQFDSLALTADGAASNRWYTFPSMMRDEVLVFRAFDSEAVKHQQPFWAPHTAFLDPPFADIPRSSVEMRAICLFFD